MDKLRLFLDEDEMPKTPPPTEEPEGSACPSNSSPSHQPFSNSKSSLPSEQPDADTFDSDWGTAAEEQSLSTPLRNRLRMMDSSVESEAALNDRSEVRMLRGTSADRDQIFCPLLAISRYPYRFIFNKTISQDVASTFFHEGKFWRRGWDIWYIYPCPAQPLQKPLLLVPAYQVESLFRYINKYIPRAKVDLFQEEEDVGIWLKFDYESARLRPRYLGFFAEHSDYVEYQRNPPGERLRPADEPEPQEPSAGNASQLNFKLEKAADLGKSRKQSKAGRREERLKRHSRWRNELKQAERFLGLRPPQVARTTAFSWEAGTEAPPDPFAMQPADRQAYEDANQLRRHPPPIDALVPPLWEFDSDVVIICVDVEGYERNRRQILEYGVTTLDTRDLYGIAPGKLGVNWRDKIKARHFLIQDNMHLHNGRYVADNSRYFNFGKSEIVSLARAPAKIAKCFRPPYPEPEVPSSSHTGAGKQAKAVERRTIVVLGHDVKNDIDYSKTLGYDITNLGSLHRDYPFLDTQHIHRVIHRNDQNPGLWSVLSEMEIEAWHLHNAGNDAMYTMQAFLALVVKSAVERGNKEIADQREKARLARVAETGREGVEPLLEDNEGWSSTDDEAKEHDADDAEKSEDEGGVKI